MDGLVEALTSLEQTIALALSPDLVEIDGFWINPRLVTQVWVSTLDGQVCISFGDDEDVTQVSTPIDVVVDALKGTHR